METEASWSQVPAWMKERFPPDQWVMFFVLYGTAALIGRALVTEGSVVLGLPDLWGFLASWCFFLMLRVFDEHKDFDLDLVNHPERVLQSGRISLGHLKVLGGLAIGAQAAVSFGLDGGWGPISGSWIITFVWSSLMAVEFFIGSWLEKRLVLYAFSHMLVMPMALVWLAQMGAQTTELPLAIGMLAALSFLSGASFEVTRKAKGIEEERETIQSYSQILGRRGAAAAVLGFLLGATALLWTLLAGLLEGGMSGLWIGLVCVLPLVPAASLFLYLTQPTAAARKRNEMAVGAAMLGQYGLLVAAVVIERGIVWS